MKRFLLALCVGVIFLTGCSSGENEKLEVDAITTMKTKIEDLGYEITDTIEPAFSIIGASAGVKYNVDGSFVEIYKFDDLSSSTYTDIKDKGESGPLKGVVNKNYVLSTKSTPEDIIKAFQDLK